MTDCRAFMNLLVFLIKHPLMMKVTSNLMAVHLSVQARANNDIHTPDV